VIGQWSERTVSAPFRRDRGREIEALAQATAQLADAHELLLALDPFRKHVHAQGLFELDDRPHQDRNLAPTAQGGDERTVDLQDVDREPLEVAER
jgi:hypothetical protein